MPRCKADNKILHNDSPGFREEFCPECCAVIDDMVRDVEEYYGMEIPVGLNPYALWEEDEDGSGDDY